MLMTIVFFVLGLWFAAIVPLFVASVLLEMLRRVSGWAGNPR